MLFAKKSSFNWLVVGLGNPGMEYENSRHNAGFMAADKIAQEYNMEFNKCKMNAVYGDFKIGDKRILLAKPQTYMNNSGKAVSQLASFYKIPEERILIMFDDISLDVGKIRIRRKGSHGGHNGMKDIIQLIGTDELVRIKIGVGAKPNPEYDLADWVLGKIPKEQKNNMDTALNNACKAATEIITKGIDSAMNQYSS